MWWLSDVSDYHAFSGQVGFVTRLHVRYDRAHFPEDLVFQTTSDQTNFQGRYIIQHPYTGDMQCDEAEPYKQAVWERQHKEAGTLADLTGWAKTDVQKRMKLTDTPPKSSTKSWYQKLWK